MSKKGTTGKKEERRKETLRLAILAQSGDQDAVDDLCEILKPLMVSIYSELSIKNVIMSEEITSLGREAVIRALGPFDSSKSDNFGNYCYRWIRNNMENESRNRLESIKLPSSFYSEKRKITAVRDKLTGELGRPPTYEEIEKDSEFSLKRIKRVMEAPTSGSMSSIHDTVGDMAVQLHEIIADESAEIPFYEADFNSKIKYVKSIMDKILDDRQRQMLGMIYGLEGSRKMTLEEVSEIHGVTPERVRQIVKRSIGQIKEVAIRDGEI